MSYQPGWFKLVGGLMRRVEEEDRKILWHIVLKVLKAQADLHKVQDL